MRGLLKSVSTLVREGGRAVFYEDKQLVGNMRRKAFNIGLDQLMRGLRVRRVKK